MKYRFLKIMAVLICLFQLDMIYASECYHYHTKTIHEIKAEDGKAFWVQTVKDPNGISIVSYKKIPLEGVKTAGLRLVSETGEGIIVADTDYYYWLDKNPYTFEEHGAGKIIESRQVSERFGTTTFRVNGKWTHIDYSPYTKKATLTPIPGFPDSPEVIKHFTEGRSDCYLIKNRQQVYAYNEGEKSVNIIPGLDPAQTRFYQTDWAYDNHFLYDDNTFYLIGVNFDDPQDISEQFRAQGLEHKFTRAKIRQTDWNIFLDFGDGNIWGYIKAGLDLQDGTSVYFYPVEQASYLSSANLVRYHQKLYKGAWELANNQYAYDIDISRVKHAEKLEELFPDVFWDGEMWYQLQYEPALMAPASNGANINTKNIATRHNNAAGSYQNAVAPFFTDGEKMFRWNAANGQFSDFRPYQKIKDLKLAWLIDDQLYIENEFVANTMDFNTAEFIGSKVAVISSCDGGDGQYPVVVKYDYYFKDKDGIYLYNGDKKLLNKLAIDNPQAYTEAEFIHKLFRD